MSKSLVEINKNMCKNLTYSIEFFDYMDYELTIENPTMLDGNAWQKFLDNTDKLVLPLKDINAFSRSHKIWYRNNSAFDKLVIELDVSPENNLAEFIARKAKYKNIDLSDMKKLGCILKMNYINNYGFQTSHRLYVGRPEINTYTDDKLILNINQLNKILKGSTFEDNVIKSPTGSFFNFVSLKDAFSYVYNIPHGIIDTKSFAGTPFRLDESLYHASETQDIVLTDGNLQDNMYIYAESTVANTTDYIHCQFFYTLEEPSCGIKFTKYDDNGDKLELPEAFRNEYTSTSDWRVWGNQYDKEAGFTSAGSVFLQNVITEYARYFRPFKAVIAGSNETAAYNDGNYRIVRNFLDELAPTNEVRNDFYDPQVQSYYWRQTEVVEGDYICESGDVLVYFEQLGDVRFGFSDIETANVLYDCYSNVYVYNLTKNIVYFNHIANHVISLPLPKQWLDIDDYILTDNVVFASQLSHASSDNEYYLFVSNIKPMCHISSLKSLVCSYRSYKTSQNSYGYGGSWSGNKYQLPFAFGNWDLTTEIGRSNVETVLDYITENFKPKTIRINDSGTKIYFLRTLDTAWEDDWTVELVDQSNYTSYSQIPSAIFFESKNIYVTKSDDTLDYNQKEYNHRRVVSIDLGAWHFEVCKVINEYSVIPTNNLNISYVSTGGLIDTIEPLQMRIMNTKTVFATHSDRLLFASVNTPAINSFVDDSGNVFWCYGDTIYSTLDTIKTYTDYTVLDHNADTNRAILVSTSDLVYMDTSTDTAEYTKSIFGWEYLLTMDRTRFIFTSPIYGSSGDLVAIRTVIKNPVRLLAYSGNRYAAGNALAASYLKNVFYDGDGILNIGFTGGKYEITDFDVIENSIQRYKYDSLEWYPMTIEKNVFKSTDTDDAETAEEEELVYDESISINMWSNKDVQLDFTVTRTSSTEITWYAVNEFNKIGESGTVAISGFNYFYIELTGTYEGITIYCNFYNTELAQGEKFRGTIERRNLSKNVVANEIIGSSQDFPFLDDQVLNLSFPFLYEKRANEFFNKLNSYFVYGSDLREHIEFDIVVPCLLYFTTSYQPFNANNIITLQSDTKYVSGYCLTDGVITKYNDNKCDYYIENIKYDKKNAKTTLKLISV